MAVHSTCSLAPGFFDEALAPDALYEAIATAMFGHSSACFALGSEAWLGLVMTVYYPRGLFVVLVLVNRTPVA
jgi:phage head maturation protease